MSADQTDKANHFRALHTAPGTFLIANVWDGGSARILSGLGFQALARLRALRPRGHWVASTARSLATRHSARRA
jgi:hypothetical protein